jgi:hypothetical protein
VHARLFVLCCLVSSLPRSGVLFAAPPPSAMDDEIEELLSSLPPSQRFKEPPQLGPMPVVGRGSIGQRR